MNNNIDPCVNGLQHFWLPTTGEGLPCYSCPMCGQLVYWSDTLLSWVKPLASGDKLIEGNAPKTPNLERSE